MKAYSLILGARNSGRGRGRFRAADDKLLRRLTTEHFPAGFSVLNVRGGWFDASAGRFIEEESRQVTVTADREASVRRWALALARAFNQQEVLVVVSGAARRWRVRARTARTTLSV